MHIRNREIAEIFAEIADLLEIDGAGAYRVRAYREAARVIPGLSESLADLVDRGEDLTELPSIGEAIAKKIRVIVETGRLPQLDEVKQRVPESLREIMQLGGLGPKRVRALHEELGIDSLDGLKEAVEAGRVHAVSGFGKKTEEGIKARLANWQGQEARTPLIEAEEVVKILVRYLAAGPGVEDVAPAGSFRRRQETVGDLDLLVACEDPVAIMDRFVGYEEVREVVSKGETRSTVRLRSGMQVDLRVVPKASWGAALHYFTGSKAHNIAVRRRGVERGLKINEYGVFRGEDQIAGETEEAVYESVGLAFIAPELREDRGEVAAAESGTLPRLLSLEDIRGDLHVHTKASDGHDGLEAMAEAAAERGCCLEVNAQPSRLDLTDVACKMAKEAGVKVAISTDAHSRDGLNNMRFGVWQARRGWLRQADVINTRSLRELGRLLERA